MKTKSFLSILTGLILGLASGAESASASEPGLEALQASIRDLQSVVQKLQTRMESQNEALKSQSRRVEILEKLLREGEGRGGVNLPLSAAASPAGPGLAGFSRGFNPDIGVTGTVQAKLTESSADEEGNDTVALKELEISFAQAVDPYSRLDAILAFNDALEEQNTEIEEAYYTRWGLPLDFTGQIGKFRAKIGKQNLLHLHGLPTADYPLVIRDFFGEEGLASSGVRLQNHVPNPWDIPFEVTGELLRGNNGNSFSGVSRRPIFNTHAKTYFEVSEDLGLELGGTVLFGDENPPGFVFSADGTAERLIRAEGQDRYGVKVFGLDATFQRFLAEARELKWQNEVYFQDRSSLVHANDDPWGFYTLVDYRFSKRFSAGVRFDYLEPLDVIGQHNQSNQISPYLIFWQSEFADFKIQYSHSEFAGAENETDDAVLFQVDFLIGSHKHPVQ